MRTCGRFCFYRGSRTRFPRRVFVLGGVFGGANSHFHARWHQISAIVVAHALTEKFFEPTPLGDSKHYALKRQSVFGGVQRPGHPDSHLL